MCFNKANHEKKIRQLEKRYGVKDRPADKLQTHYHESGFQHLEAPIILSEQSQQFSFYTWGLYPTWAHSLQDALDWRNKTLNARAEEVFTKRSFRDCIAQRRCLIPVTGFFEHMEFKGKKYPHFISIRSHEFFSLAGIYNQWRDPTTDKTYYTYSILTCEANTLMAKIHHTKKRMPVIVPKELERDWLKADLSEKEIKTFFVPYAEEDMQAHSVSRLITSRKENNDVPEVQLPYTYPELTIQTSLF